MFSDGMTDQFSANGEDKFGFRRLKSSLTSNHDKPTQEMLNSVSADMDKWMGDHRQMDDMLLMTVRL